MSRRRPSRFAGLQITRGALIVLGLELGLSLVWLLSDVATRQRISAYLAATPENVFEHYRVWTLATGVLLEHEFISLILHGVVMWMFVPTLERFWGTPRFYRFAVITSLIGTLAGTLVGHLLGTSGVAIGGLDPLIYASIVAFGVIYAKQPVQFFGVVPLTGRQLMYGFLAFLALFVALQQIWAVGAAFAAAMIAAAVMTSKRWSPGLVWRRWRVARARRKLAVLEGGAPAARGRPPLGPPDGGGRRSSTGDDHKWLN